MLIGYARVSTFEQNPALQLDALTAAGCDQVFTEKASGIQPARPELSRTLAALCDGDTLVVWRLDRLARSLRQLIDTVDLLQSRGVGFRSLTEAIDTTTSTGRLVFHMLAALAEFERNVIHDRTVAGLDAARARGRHGGRPPTLTGQMVKEAAVLLADPELTVAQVARRLNIATSTLYRHLPAGRFGPLM